MSSSMVRELERGLSESYTRKLARSILGTETPHDIAGMLTRFCEHHLGWVPSSCFLFELSVGAVFGLSKDDRKCILKVFSPDAVIAVLKAQSEFQQYLHQHAYPCPPVLVAPTRGEGIVFAVEGFLGDGRRANGHLKEDRKLLATALAELIALGKQYPKQDAFPQLLLRTVEGSPWLKPHNILFDFPATKAGAEWIDDVGRRYRHVIEAPQEPLVIGHIDWGAKHTRILDQRISAIYDWDSVGRIPETRIVGQAAINFTTTWYVDCANKPDLDELLEFIDIYESARGEKFSADQRRLLADSMLYGAAYGARCEHAIKEETDRTENRDFLKMLLAADMHGRLLI